MIKNAKIYCVGVGGQGNILMSKIIGEALLKSGANIIMSEIHGMAQRGGIVETTILYGDYRGTIISDGEADILIGFEPLETFRAITKCSDKTVVITNTHPIYPYTVTLGQSEYIDIDWALREIKSRCASLHAFDAFEIAKSAGSAKSVNVVMLGFLVGLNLLPISKDSAWQAITNNIPKKIHELNHKAFHLGISKAKSF